IIQASTLENISGASSEPDALTNVLEQTSWNFGRNFAESVWGTAGDMTVREATRAFLQSQFYGEKTFLPERITDREAILIWKHSPLQEKAVKDSPAISMLCNFHEHVIRGFFYALSRTGKLDTGRTRLGETTHPCFTLLSIC
ncbi:MAG: hypothetical protein EBX52_00330, partial [Proteobacteria bacterium]|nr:hypothetical protein [Pseudomonadota bacterium]